MGRIVLLVFIITYGLSCSQSANKKDLPGAVMDKIKTEAKEWVTDFCEFKSTEFNLTDTFRIRSRPDTTTATELDSFYAIYKPLIRFSPDGRFFADLYSYQLNLEREGDHFAATPEIDQQVELFDTKENTTYSLVYGGTENRIDEALWLDNNSLILAGIRKDSLANRHPVIYFVDTNTGLIQEFSCSDEKCIQKSRYSSPGLSRLKITGL